MLYKLTEPEIEKRADYDKEPDMQEPLPKRKDKFAILKEYFGYTEFRPGQEVVIDAILAGKDALAVMPTGAGKSLCYQIPSLMLGGFTVVISPLISLMKDQVNALREAGVRSACLNSSLSPEEYAATMKLLYRGECRILYVAPERLLKEDFLQILQKMENGTVPQKTALVVIDEAHCVSQWGHDFRPSYLHIAHFIAALNQRPVIAAFTATATQKVKNDILSILSLHEPFTITTGFDRKNLYFEVQKPKNKSAALLDYLRRNKHKSGIVYCNTRKAVEEVWGMLLDRNLAAAKYHAGLEDAERHENQDDFLYDRKTILVATNAFGMGIDKSNVSFVIHYNMPKNIESYYQEAGRAGRDGEPAECILFYSGHDVRINEFLITHAGDEETPPDEALIRHNLELLKFMTWYATGTDCLRSRLLNYFGEHAPSFCGNCSNCTMLFEDIDITVEAQKLISCVLRLEQRGRRFGKTLIIDIVRGSKNEKIRNFHLDTLSTYGIMKDSSLHRARLILDFLIEQGYLALNSGEFPVVQASERSGEIVFERKRVRMMLPKEKQPERKAELVPAVQEFDEALFEKLRDLRRSVAQEAGVPSYIVFSDAALRDMCRKKPVTKQEFLRISGVGEIKMKKYGDVFTALIMEYTASEKSGE
ncbi:MAG: DNA helicase RecQ [Treponema sp.]|jgi:ATP-dependent DNA helicase RecQ|nr:DNA helicase RecQ [Treponema sp.]